MTTLYLHPKMIGGALYLAPTVPPAMHVPPTGEITVQDDPDGQSIYFELVTAHVTSGSYTLVGKNGATNIGPIAIPIVNNAAAVTIETIYPADYDFKINLIGPDGAIELVGTPISINPVSGGGSVGVVLPVSEVTGVSITPATATGSTVFNVVVTGTGAFSPAYNLTKVGNGTLNGNAFTEPVKTNVPQVTTIRATSVQNPLKFAEAVVTTPAAVVVVDPPVDTTPTVTGFTVTPANAVVDGSLDFDVVVLGLNNPPQGVTYETDLGSVTVDGTVTVTKTNQAQTGHLTITSTFDPDQSITITFTVPALVVVVDPVTGVRMTPVRFHFLALTGLPMVNSDVDIYLPKPIINEQARAIALPGRISVKTDNNGFVIVPLMPADRLYTVAVYDPVQDTGASYKFLVPTVTAPTIVDLQDLIVTQDMIDTDFDAATLLQIINAKNAAQAAAAQAQALLDSLTGAEGAKKVGYKTGTVYSALEAGGTGSGGGSGNGSGINAELGIPDSSLMLPTDLDGSQANVFTIKVTANFSLPVISNPQPGVEYKIFLIQDIAGSHTVTLDNKYKFSGNVKPIPSTAGSSIDLLESTYLSMGFFMSRYFNAYSVTGLTRIGTTIYESMAQSMLAAVEGDTLYVTRSGQMSECVGSQRKDITVTIAGDPSITGIPELRVDATVTLAGQKAILNPERGNVTIRDLKLYGAASPDLSGAGIRGNPDTRYLRLERGVTNRCNNGMLTSAAGPDAEARNGFTIEIVDWEFDDNGTGNDGQSHNIYLGHGHRAYVLRSRFTNSQHGHDFKSRAAFVLLDRTYHAGGNEGRQLDLPNGGVLHAVNSSFIKMPTKGTGQASLMGIGQEGATNLPQEYIFRNCLLQNDWGANFSETFIMQENAAVSIKFVDCVFIGPSRCVMVTPFELYYTGGPIGPEGWDQSVTGIVPKKGTYSSQAGNAILPADQQPVAVYGPDPTLAVFPPTGSSAVRSVRPDL